MVKFNETDYKDWEQFRLGENKDVISPAEFELVCNLHAKHYGHTYYKPCTCSPKTINKWIQDLNLVWTYTRNGDK